MKSSYFEASDRHTFVNTAPLRYEMFLLNVEFFVVFEFMY